MFDGGWLQATDQLHLSALRVVRHIDAAVIVAHVNAVSLAVTVYDYRSAGRYDAVVIALQHDGVAGILRNTVQVVFRTLMILYYVVWQAQSTPFVARHFTHILCLGSREAYW